MRDAEALGYMPLQLLRPLAYTTACTEVQAVISVVCVHVCAACREDQFKCHNTGRCIPASAVCDNNNDCGDWSDQLNCS